MDDFASKKHRPICEANSTAIFEARGEYIVVKKKEYMEVSCNWGTPKSSSTSIV
jgi:phage gp45-like